MADLVRRVDFLVVGSGAAGMAGALRAHDRGARVLLVEKAEVLGGSTAMSGGVCWVGANPSMKERGVEDSPDDVLRYLRAITGGEVEERLLRAYRDQSLAMLAYLESETHVRFDALERYADYYPEAEGGRLGGRSMEARPFDASELGEHFARLRRPAKSAMVLGRTMLTPRDAQPFIRFGWRSLIFTLGMAFRYLLRTRKRRRAGGRDTYLAQGAALSGRLLRSMLDRGIETWTSSALTELVVEDGRVVGALVDRAGESVRIEASRGVLLAAGGFERNLAMRREHGPAPAAIDWSVSAESNTGDGIEAGRRVGADTRLLDEAWWTPVTQVPGDDSGWVLLMEKSLPGTIFVDGKGERYTNEAAPYGDVGRAMYDRHAATGHAIPSYMVFDARYRRLHLAGPVAHGRAMPDSVLPRRLREDFLVKAGSVEGLATSLGLPAERLRGTLDRFNTLARSGVDSDFHRGESASDRYYGDPAVKPNPCLAPIVEPPFYAIPVYPGDLGTKGGLVTDERARVLRTDGQRIPGLYAAGNTMASVMGRTYPGAGGTIGPALTFGFVAADAATED